MSASAVRAGGVFVEIGADPRKFFSALNKVNKSLANMGGQLVSGGGKLAAAGVGMAAPIVAAVRQGAAFESTLLNIRASTGATAAEIDKIKASAMDMSRALGVGPTEAAGGMLELLKAGVPLQTVLEGAGKAALEFSKVAGLDGVVAATVMSKAMNAFGVDAATAANSMSSAADASATSVEEMAQAFSQASAVAASSNQGINDLSAALAVLANKGIVGSDAGTSIKTMLQKLKVPTTDAAKALAQVGLSFESFRGEDKQLLPLVDIIKTLETALGRVDQATRDDVLGNVFGSDAIRAATILTQVGVGGFESMQAAMASALPVGEKYKILMSGLAGAGGNILAAMQRLAIAISGAVAPAISGVVPFITGLIDGLTDFATKNGEAVAGFAKLAVGAIAVGSAMVAIGYSLKGLSGGIGLVLKGFGLFSALASPVLLVAAGIGAAVFALYEFKDQIGAALGPVAPLVEQAAGAIGQAFGPAISDAMVVFGDLYKIASQTVGGIYDAIASGDLSGAMDILWAGLVAGWLRGVEALMSYVDPWVTAFQDVFTDIGSGIYIAWDKIYTDSAALLNTMGAFIMGFFDNIANGVMATFDNLVAGIQIAWTRVQGFITGAKDTQKRIQAIKDKNAARAEQRRQERPGIEGRTAAADRENRKAGEQRQERAKGIREDAQATKDARQAENARRADERRAATQAAEANLESASSAASDRSRDAAAASQLMEALGSATTLDQITSLGSSIDALLERGNVSGGVEQKLMDAYYAAFSRVNVSAAAADSPSEKAATAGAAAAGAQSTQSMGQVAGTFSSLNLGSVFGGTSLAERTARAAEETAKNTRKIDDGGKVAA